MFLKKIYLIILIVSINCVHGQDPLFTQFFSNALQLNPSLAGRDLVRDFIQLTEINGQKLITHLLLIILNTINSQTNFMEA